MKDCGGFQTGTIRSAKCFKYYQMGDAKEVVIIAAHYYTEKGNLVHSWDLVFPPRNLNK